MINTVDDLEVKQQTAKWFNVYYSIIVNALIIVNDCLTSKKIFVYYR